MRSGLHTRDIASEKPRTNVAARKPTPRTPLNLSIPPPPNLISPSPRRWDEVKAEARISTCETTACTTDTCFNALAVYFSTAVSCCFKQPRDTMPDSGGNLDTYRARGSPSIGASYALGTRWLVSAQLGPIGCPRFISVECGNY